MSIAWQIRQAIRQELQATAPFHEFTALAAERDGPIWKISVDPFASRAGLDESLEGAGAAWDGGDAEILAADPDADLLILQAASATPPTRGGTIRAYPPRFLHALEQVWSEEEWSTRCEQWMDEALATRAKPTPLPNRFVPWLRTSQEKALALPGLRAGFLWGPPGTGKTTTLGATLATYLLTHPSHRILLLSTTNSAVDIALVNVDRALEKIGRRAARARRSCARVGGNFIASNYLERAHLVPRADKDLLGQLARLEGTKPDPRQVRDYERWRNEVNWIRSQLTAQTEQAVSDYNLVAMTASRAVFNIETLREHEPFDLVVFDEASQVSIPYALALAPLGKSALFAGDPQQLAPVVRAKSKEARAWMGQSMFKWMDRLPTCFLPEQSRMAVPICDVVSRAFYNGKLRVAPDEARNETWKRDHSSEGAPPRWKRHVIIQQVFKDGGYSQKYRGQIRQQSAYFITHDLQSLLIHTPPEEILVLTPFRAQRNLIRAFLRNANIRGVDVTTVHRAQGTERHTILFDPVSGPNRFLQGDAGARLINVALSRAKARLILYLSENDRENETLNSLVHLSRGLRSA